jgi:hypothetical protein
LADVTDLQKQQPPVARDSDAGAGDFGNQSDAEDSQLAAATARKIDAHWRDAEAFFAGSAIGLALVDLAVVLPLAEWLR